MPTWLSNLKINRVASVDKGAGEGVQVVLVKRDEEVEKAVEGYLKREFSEDKRKELASSGKALPDGSFPIENVEDLKNAIHAYGRAKDKAKAKAHIIARAKSLGESGLIPDGWREGAEKKLTIWHGADGSVTIEHDPEAGEKTEERKGKPGGKAQSRKTASKTLKKSIESILGDASVTDKGAMILKSVDEFEDWFAKALTMGVTVEGADAQIVNKEAEMADKEAEEKKAEAEKEHEETKKSLKKALRDIAVLKMSKGEKEFYDLLKSEKDKEDFEEADAEKRADCMKKAPVEKALPESVQKQLEEFTVMKAAFAEMQKAHKKAEFEKRATDMGLGAEFGETLAKAYSGDAEAITKLEQTVKGLHTQVEKAGLFKNFGANAVKSGSAYEQLIAKAEELRKSDKKLTKEQAFSKVFGDPENSELTKQYRAEQRGAAN